MFAEKGVQIPGFVYPALWEHIENLLKYEQKHGLRAGSRLTNKHVYYDRYKMKVALAAQIFSNSTATALDLLREELELQEFADTAATKNE